MWNRTPAVVLTLVLTLAAGGSAASPWPVVRASAQAARAQCAGERAPAARHLSDWVRRGRTGSPAATGPNGTAARALVLACAIGRYGTRPWLVAALARHGAVLAATVPGGEAALPAAVGLLVAGCAGGNAAWTEAAHARIETLLARRVDGQGVSRTGAVRDTATDHAAYATARRRLLACGLRPGPVFARVDRMPDFLTQAAAPDGRYARIGAGEPLRVRSGTPRPDPYRVYDEGYVFARSVGSVDLFTTLRFGAPSTRVHGHADTGALTLDAGGTRLLADPGDSPTVDARMRRYLASRTAHDTVDVGGAPYRAATPVTTHHADRYDVTTLRVTTPAGAVWTRTVVYSRRGGYLVVDDRITSPRPVDVVQRWNLPAGHACDRTGWSVATTGPGADVTVYWVGSRPELSATTGQEEPLLGWQVDDAGRAVPAPLAEARLHGTSTRFTTVLVPRPDTAPPSWVGQVPDETGAVRVTVSIGDVVEAFIAGSPA
jgi:hypothetical protein